MPLGINCKIYRNTGTYGSPTWSEVHLFSDVQISPSWAEALAQTRGYLLEASAKTLAKLEVTAKIRVKASDTNYAAIYAAELNRDLLDLMILNGEHDVNGVVGFRGEFQIYPTGQDQSPGVLLYDDVAIKPAAEATTNIKTVAVASGSPVFTDTFANIAA